MNTEKNISRNWTVANILTIIAMGGASLAYLDRKFDNLTTQITDNRIENTTVKQQVADHSRRLEVLEKGKDPAYYDKPKPIIAKTTEPE